MTADHRNNLSPRGNRIKGTLTGTSSERTLMTVPTLSNRRDRTGSDVDMNHSSGDVSASSTTNTKIHRNATRRFSRILATGTTTNRGRSSILLLLLLGMTILRIQQQSTASTLQQQSGAPFTIASSSVDAIVTLAIGDFRATRLAASLRDKGLWKKPIYVLTNKPELEDENLVTSIPVVADQFPDYINATQKTHLMDFMKHEYNHHWIKWHKTQVFGMLPDKSIQTILFMDSDIVIDSSLEKFLHDVQHSIVQKEECQIALYAEPWYFRTAIATVSNNKWNSGIMLLKRQASSKLLDTWGRLLLTEPYAKRDQGKLALAMELESTKVCELPSKFAYVLNEAQIVTDQWPLLLGIKPWPTFRHFTSKKNLKDLASRVYY